MITAFSDDFNRANGALDASYTVSGGTAVVNSNTCLLTPTVPNTDFPFVTRAATFRDARISFTLVDTAEIYIPLRIQTGGDRYQVNCDAIDTISIGKLVSGSFTTIKSGSPTGIITYPRRVTITIRGENACIEATVMGANGNYATAVVYDQANASLTGAGKFGFIGRSSSTTRIDNYLVETPGASDTSPDILDLTFTRVATISNMGNQEMVRHMDGSPYIVGEKVFLVIPVSTYAKIYSLDLASGATTEVATLNWTRGGSPIRDGVGPVVRDDENNRWMIIQGGYGDVNDQPDPTLSETDVRYAFTTDNILSGSHTFELAVVPLPNRDVSSYYDPSFLKTGEGELILSCTRTTQRYDYRAWQHYPAAFSLSDLEAFAEEGAWTQKWARSDEFGTEGTTLAKYDGGYYVIGGNGVADRLYRSSDGFRLSGNINYPSIFTGVSTHGLLFPINEGGSTRYYLLNFSGPGYPNPGTFAVYLDKSDQLRSGNEYPPDPPAPSGNALRNRYVSRARYQL